MLDPQSARPQIVLCVTPFSFTNWAAESNEFVARRQERLGWREQLYYSRPQLSSGLLYFFEPMEPKDLVYGLAPGLKENHYYRHYHADGWVAFDTVIGKPRNELEKYITNFSLAQAKDANVQRLLDYVERWHNRGIEVYGLALPTSPEMARIERDMGELDKEAFAARFNRAGGTWLDFDDHKTYPTFDKNHMSRRGARTFSKELARRIAASD